MKTFLSLASLAGLYVVFLIAESVTRSGLQDYFNQDYLYENLFKLLPYLMGYVIVLWVVLVASMIIMVYNKEEDNGRFATWMIFFGFVAVPLTALISPFFRVLF